MTDPIQHLRDLLSWSTPDPWEIKTYGSNPGADIIGPNGFVAGCENGNSACLSYDDAALITAAINALPALLAVAEAARKVADIGPWQLDDLEDTRVAYQSLCRALAALDKP